MKKLICALLIGTVLAGSSPVFAENADVSYSMTDALTSVKQKITVPEQLTEFDSRTSTDSKNQTSFGFSWQAPDGDESIEVICDKHGRISSYYNRDNGASDSGIRLSKYTKADAQAFAETFLRKLLPETFTDTDNFKCRTEDSRGVLRDSGTYYTFNFVRLHNGIEVNDNSAYVRINADNEKMTVRSVTCEYSFDAVFDTPENIISDPDAAYKTVYPAQLCYIEDYTAEESGKKARAVYKISENCTGCISAATGEKAAEYKEAYSYKYSEDAEAENLYAGSSAGGSGSFTPQETAELGNISGLKSTAEIETMLRSLKELKMTDEMLLSYSSVYGDDSGYMMRLTFSDNGKRRLSAVVNAESGRIKYIGNYTDSKGEKSQTDEAAKVQAEETSKAFFKQTAAEIFDEFKVSEVTSDAENVTVSMYRYANGVPYISDSAEISYSTKENMITSYSVSYTDTEFEDITGAVSADTAYDNFLAVYPLKKLYVMTDENTYSLCFGGSKSYTDIIAVTGEPDVSEPEFNGYSDISGHWCENAVKRLADVGICLGGDSFRPDESVTKSDLLRFFADGIQNYGYVRNSLEAEISVDSDAAVSREDACVYMVRLAGYEKIAKLSDIFTVNFSDEADISSEKLGYAAILSGLGVISGNDGAFRPKDSISRAEAAAMLYTFLIK